MIPSIPRMRLLLALARFTPARLRGHRVRVLPTIPLTFRAM